MATRALVTSRHQRNKVHRPVPNQEGHRGYGPLRTLHGCTAPLPCPMSPFPSQPSLPSLPTLRFPPYLSLDSSTPHPPIPWSMPTHAGLECAVLANPAQSKPAVPMLPYPTPNPATLTPTCPSVESSFPLPPLPPPCSPTTPTPHPSPTLSFAS